MEDVATEWLVIGERNDDGAVLFDFNVHLTAGIELRLGHAFVLQHDMERVITALVNGQFEIAGFRAAFDIVLIAHEREFVVQFRFFLQFDVASERDDFDAFGAHGLVIGDVFENRRADGIVFKVGGDAEDDHAAADFLIGEQSVAINAS